MHKELATFKALIGGRVSIEYVSKTPIKKTPGDVTEEAALKTKLVLHSGSNFCKTS